MTDLNHQNDSDPNRPRAIIHKQIIDRAEERPEASMEAIADDVSGATTATVERVLDEYGDPVANESDDESPTDGSGSEEGEDLSADQETSETYAATDGGASESLEPAVSAESTSPVAAERSPGQRLEVGERLSETRESRRTADDHDSDGTPESPPDRSALTEKQYETLQAIYANPDATQAELADELGVSSPTISQRVNGIEGFDWANRSAFVDSLFESDCSNGQGADDRDGNSCAERRTDYEGSERGADSDDSRQRDSSDRGLESRGRRDETTDRQPDDSSAESVDERRGADLVDRVDELSRRLATVEGELSDLQDTARASRSSVLDDPELAHKIVHACMRADHISKDEELQLLRDVTTAGTANRDGSS